MSELDRKIHKWLGRGCWHENETTGFFHDPYKCKKCGKKHRVNPAYSTDPAAMLDLCTALTDEKAYFVSTASGRDFSKTYWAVRLHGLLGDEVESRADTLPLTVALAVEKLIDTSSNPTNAETRPIQPEVTDTTK